MSAWLVDGTWQPQHLLIVDFVSLCISFRSKQNVRLVLVGYANFATLRQSGVNVTKRNKFEFSTFRLFIIVTLNHWGFPGASTRPQTVPSSSSSSPTCFSVVLPIDLVATLRSDASPLWAFNSAMRSPADLDLAMLNARSWSVLAFTPAQYAQHLHQYQKQWA